jgi:hypothetical protein
MKPKSAADAMDKTAVWRDIEARFRTLRAEHGDRLRANWISTSWNDRGEQWYLSGTTSHRERERFTWIVERAAVELGHSGRPGALFFWLDLLKKASPNFRSGTVPSLLTEVEGGTVLRLLEASADYCLRLETEDISRARSPKDNSDEQAPGRPEEGARIREEQWAVCPSLPAGDLVVIKEPLLFSSKEEAQSWLDEPSIFVHEWIPGQEESGSRDDWLRAVSTIWRGPGRNTLPRFLRAPAMPADLGDNIYVCSLQTWVRRACNDVIGFPISVHNLDDDNGPKCGLQ